MALQSPLSIYSGLLKNLMEATASTPGVVAYTEDSRSLYVSNGTQFVRVSPNNHVWIVDSSEGLRATAAQVGDLTVNTGNGTTYVLTAYANKLWSPSTEFSIGDTVIDTLGNLQTVATPGISGVSEPIWATSGITGDNTIAWTESSAFIAIATIGGGGSNGAHDESLTDGNGNFIFAATLSEGGDIVVVTGVSN